MKDWYSDAEVRELLKEAQKLGFSLEADSELEELTIDALVHTRHG